jgi:succinate dehydrogenase/fumarate reductase cytochrome b subunit
MSERNTFIRSLHDIGLAAWFGGSLMGAVGLNAAASTANDPVERLTISSAGWAKWAPVQLAALAAHGVGGIGLILANKKRIADQPDVRANTVAKFIVTGVAGAVTLYAAVVGKRMSDHSSEGAAGTTTPNSEASKELASAQQQQRILQWLIPATTAVLLILTSQQGEQQRPVAGVLRSLAKKK